MKTSNLLLLLLISLGAFCQQTTKDNVFDKCRGFYINNLVETQVIERVHKNTLGYDTTKNITVYARNLNGKIGNYAFANFNDSNKLTSMMLFDEDYYWLTGSATQKIKYKKNELKNSPIDFFDLIPCHNPNNIANNLGKPISLAALGKNWLVSTNKYAVVIDTATGKIIRVIKTEFFEGKAGFTAYHYMSQKDSIVNPFRKQMDELVHAATNFPIATLKDLEKEAVSPQSFENTKFAFANLTAVNASNLDSSINGKFLIFDFFYHACYPCHQMTGYILEWMPTMDTSKIMLVGIDPVDSDPATKKFIASRNIGYPIITGKLAKEIRTFYKIQAYPTLLLVAPDGTIKIVHEGMSKSFLKKAERIAGKQ
jgi:hypothetical protein